MKQKVIMMAVLFSLTAGFTAILPSATVGAQNIPGETDTTTDPATTQEQDCAPGSDGCCGGVKTSIIGGDLCGDNSSAGEDGTIFILLKNVLTILTAGIGIAAVGGIAYGALLYTTAAGKPEQSKKAIGIITNVVIGLVAYMLMFVLLNFLIPGGVFG